MSVDTTAKVSWDVSEISLWRTVYEGCVCVCMRGVCVDVWMHVCIYIFICIYLCMYVCVGMLSLKDSLDVSETSLWRTVYEVCVCVCV